MEQLAEKPADLNDVRLQIQIVSTRDDIRMLVCRDGERVIGFAMGVISPHMHPELSPYMQIEAVVVDGAYRRQGVARRLVQTLESWASTRNCHYITLASQAKRREAHAFYKELGYDTDVAFQKFI